ncbi:MAG: protein-glutamate O-methyltransferase CheR, partial [Chitinivibrionales bacterium]|nr:protein-glutamate O-methyltransferase CheR [Chitinivibrionales bacterium]
MGGKPKKTDKIPAGKKTALRDMGKEKLCPEMSGRELETLFALLFQKTGHHFEHNKKSVVTRRVYRRISLLGIDTVGNYLALLDKNQKEISLLVNDLMIGVTAFFRDEHSWEDLKREVIAPLVREKAAQPIRVWAPGCSTGEEAYSVAMLFLRQMELAGKTRPLYVFATDINENALERAREGVFPASAVADVPLDLQERYLVRKQDGASVRIAKTVRDAVVFAKQNILVDPPFSRLDLIVCRNLFIYLEPNVQEKAITLFHYALRPEGHLFLGNAESVGKHYTLFKSLGNKKARIYKRVGPDRRSGVAFPLAYSPERQDGQLAAAA